MVQTLSEIGFEQFTPTSWDRLTQQHIHAIVAAAGISASDWRVDTHEDYDGHLISLVTARESDITDSTFVLSGRVQHIELAELLGNDDLCPRGYFHTIEAAAAALAEATSARSR